MQTQVEELASGKVRLDIEVPRADIQHAIDHAASDLAGSLKIPGFRKGKVPMPVLLARVGRERLYSEAVESHIRGWFWDAAARSGIRPVAQPEFGYELPDSPDAGFRFTATVAVQQPPEVADWTNWLSWRAIA
jgi:trigger factor